MNISETSLLYINKLKLYWQEYGLETLVLISLAVIIILYFFNRNKQGSWDRSVYYTTAPPLKKSPPVPQTSKGELKCRQVLQKIFKRPFNKARPDILRNPITGGENNLELDCYDEELKLAVEYNGVQHYKFIPFMHRNKETFHNQKYRDYVKRNLCAENGINLIEVPYTVRNEEIEEFLIEKLTNLGYL